MLYRLQVGITSTLKRFQRLGVQLCIPPFVRLICYARVACINHVRRQVQPTLDTRRSNGSHPISRSTSDLRPGLGLDVDLPEFVLFVRTGPEESVLVEAEAVRTSARLHERREFAFGAPHEDLIVRLVREVDVPRRVRRGAFGELESARELFALCFPCRASPCERPA